MKLSKTSMLILSAGIFIVVLAGLGLTRSQQLQQQTELDDELGVAELRLDNLQVTQLHQQQGELQERLDESITQLNVARDRLHQTVESIDVTDEFFSIAESCGVKVMSIGSSTIAGENLKGIDFFIISLNANVSGQENELIDFIISLNNGFTTGVVESVRMSIPEALDEEAASSAGIRMVAYSYEED